MKSQSCGTRSADQYAMLADLTGDSLSGRVADFWSPGLSPARLRALATPATTTAAPDLLLRMFEPPPLQVRGRSLGGILAPAYERLASDDDPEIS